MTATATTAPRTKNSTPTAATPAPSAPTSGPTALRSELRSASFAEGEAMLVPPASPAPVTKSAAAAPAALPARPLTIEYSDDWGNFQHIRDVQAALEKAAPPAIKTPVPTAYQAAEAPANATPPPIKTPAPTAHQLSQRGYEVSGQNDKSASTYAVGEGGGNREEDLPTLDPKAGAVKAPKASTVNMTDVAGAAAKPKLDKLSTESKTEHANGVYVSHSEAHGATAGFGGDTKVNAGYDVAQGESSGVVSKDLAYAQAGSSQRDALGIAGEEKMEHGTASGSAELYFEKYAGASASAGVSEKGAVAEGAIGVGGQLGVKGEAKLASKGIVGSDGKEIPVASVGASGEVDVAARAGASGSVAIGPEKVGAEGKAGAFAGFEAKGDVTATLGPITATAEAGGMVGAGAGAEGAIKYEDGKLVVGGRAFAALGFGGSTGPKVEVDFVKGYELAKWAVGRAIPGAEQARADLGECEDTKVSPEDEGSDG